MKHSKRMIFVSLLVLAFCFGFSIFWTNQQLRQNRLNAELMDAIHYDNETKLVAVLDAGASPNAQECWPERSSNPFTFLKRLFVRHPKSEECAQTALGMAAICAKTPIVKILLEHGADPNARTEQLMQESAPTRVFFVSDSTTPLLMTSGEDLEITRLLLEHGADPNAKDEGGTVLQRTYSGERKKLIMKYGAK